MAATRRPSSNAPAGRLPRVFVVGDSISIQYGPYLERFLSGVAVYDRKGDEPGQAKAEQNLDYPTGANGGDSGMVLAYLRARESTGGIAADWIVLNCGLHDLRRKPQTGQIQVPLDAYEKNLRAILKESEKMNLSPVWVRTTPVIDMIHNARVKSQNFHRFAVDVEAFNAAADRVMAQAGVPIIDLHRFTALFIPDGFVDHVHYTEPVREKQAAYLAGALSVLVGRRWR